MMQSTIMRETVGLDIGFLLEESFTVTISLRPTIIQFLFLRQKFLCSSPAEITITIQYLYLNWSHINGPFCEQRLKFITTKESKTYCNPRLEVGTLQEESLKVGIEGNHLDIIFTKCSNTEGGKFWIQFTGIDRIFYLNAS